jgi:hypothetical protein
MISRLFVIVGAMLIGSAPVFADAFYASSVIFNLTFPTPVLNTFGYGGPVAAFQSQGPGSSMQSQTGSAPTYTTKIQDSGNATPVNDIFGSDAATVSARLGNLSDVVYNAMFSVSFSYTLEALADTAQDSAVADLYLQVLAGGVGPTGWNDVFDSVTSTNTKAFSSPIIMFTIPLPPDSVTPLLVYIGVAGEAVADAVPVVPPPLPPPVNPVYPGDPIPEPSFFWLVTCILGFFAAWRHNEKRSIGLAPAGVSGPRGQIHGRNSLKPTAETLGRS